MSGHLAAAREELTRAHNEEIRKRFLQVPLRLSLVHVALGGALIVAAGVLLGNA